MNETSEVEKPKPRSLRLVRESRLLDLSTVAIATGISPSKLTAFEEDRDVPTRGVLKALAKHYAVPIYFFYVENLVLPEISIPDFRSIETTSAKLHDNLAASIERAQELRDVSVDRRWRVDRYRMRPFD